LELWIKNQEPLNGRVISRDNGSSTGWQMRVESRPDRVDTNKAVFFARAGGTEEIVWSTTDVNDGQWHHVVGIRSGGALSIFVDGQFNATSATSNLSTTTPMDLALEPVYIGTFRNITGNPAYEGWIDEVAIYNSALSADRIEAHYEAGVVPEPSTLVLLGIGLLALPWMHFRYRR